MRYHSDIHSDTFIPLPFRRFDPSASVLNERRISTMLLSSSSNGRARCNGVHSSLNIVQNLIKVCSTGVSSRDSPEGAPPARSPPYIPLLNVSLLTWMEWNIFLLSQAGNDSLVEAVLTLPFSRWACWQMSLPLFRNLSENTTSGGWRYERR